MMSDVEPLFMFIDHLYVLFGEMSVQVLCPVFNWIVCLPGVELCEFFTYFGIKPPHIGWSGTSLPGEL